MKTVLLVSLSLLACSKSDSKAPEKAVPPPVTIDVAAVNALVPAALKDKIVFEKQEVVEERGHDKVTYTLAAPKGWGPGDMKMFAKVRPPEGAFGNLTGITLGSNCDGRCEPKDWAKTSEKVDFEQFRKNKVVKEESTPTSHLLISADNDGAVFVMYAWWAAGAPRYFTCMATLDKSFRPEALAIGEAAPSFAKACQAVSVAGK